MRFCQFLIFCLLLGTAVVARAQTAPPGVNVKLSLLDNKTVYKIGEPIKLLMEFTADREVLEARLKRWRDSGATGSPRPMRRGRDR